MERALPSLTSLPLPRWATRPVAGLLAASLLALLAVACGASSETTAGADGAGSAANAALQDAIDSGTASPLGLTEIAQTLEQSEEAGSASFDGSIELIPSPGADVASPVSIVFSGSYSLPDRSARVVLDLSGVSGALGPELDLSVLFAEPMEVVTVDDQTYVRGGVVSLLGSDRWVRLDGGEAGFLGDQIGIHEGRGPIEVLQALEDADATIEDLGRETVRGVDTRHVLATVDLTGLEAGTGSGDHGYWDEQLGGSGLTELPIDLWIGDDGLVYRFQLNVDREGSDVPVPGPGGQFDELSFMVELFDHGVDPEITAPLEADTISAGDLSFDD
jgi:hypothetical protein